MWASRCVLSVLLRFIGTRGLFADAQMTHKTKNVKNHWGWEGLASGGQLKAGHLVLLHGIKAPATKGPGRERAACWPCVHQGRGSCMFNTCMQCAPNNFNTHFNSIINLRHNVAHRLWENNFDKYSEFIQLYNATFHTVNCCIITVGLW